MTDIIILDIGGVIEKTTITTLRNRPDTVLSAMFAEGKQSMLIKQSNGSIFIDANPKIFNHILDLYRRPELDPNIIPEGINKNLWHAELNYWCIPYDSEIEERTIVNPNDIKNQLVEQLMNSLNKLPKYLDCLKFNKICRHIILPKTYVFETNLGEIDIVDWFSHLNQGEYNINKLFKKYNVEMNIAVVAVHTYHCLKIGCIYCESSSFGTREYPTLRKLIEKEIPTQIITQLELEKKPLAYLIIEFI